ncbi:MAG: cytochrome P450 [Myxococcota bacterium]|nr:cytochrome P450 [Myxococcota bacterium]
MEEAVSPTQIPGSPETTLPSPDSLHDPEETLKVILEPRERGRLYEYLDRLRDLTAIHPTELLHGRPGWVITTHAHASEVLSNHALISDARNAEVFNIGPSGEHFFEMIKRTLLFIGPIDHTRQRRMISRFFTPRAVEKHRPRIEKVVSDLVDRAEGMGRFDLVEDLAYALPTAVICELLGTPKSDLPIIHDWLGDFARRGDVSGVTEEVVKKGEEATRGYTTYFTEQIKERRGRPRDDLMSEIIQSEDENGSLRDEELIAIFTLMIQAGHETTADMIGLGMLALLRHPDQLERLREDPTVISNAVDEMLRYDGSNQLVQRVGVEDFELGGVTIPAGEVCGILTGAANRDPLAFEHPDRLDIHRRSIRHFGFGGGNHICVGAPLARIEIETMIGNLVERFPRLTLVDEEPEFRGSLVLRGLKSMELTAAP